MYVCVYFVFVLSCVYTLVAALRQADPRPRDSTVYRIKLKKLLMPNEGPYSHNDNNNNEF
jgi:hypothetical protein